MQVFIQIVLFSLQTDGSGRPVLTKGKRPYTQSKQPWDRKSKLKLKKTLSKSEKKTRK